MIPVFKYPSPPDYFELDVLMLDFFIHSKFFDHTESLEEWLNKLSIFMNPEWRSKAMDTLKTFFTHFYSW